jgi:hypothetical protein
VTADEAVTQLPPRPRGRYGRILARLYTLVEKTSGRAQGALERARSWSPCTRPPGGPSPQEAYGAPGALTSARAPPACRRRRPRRPASGRRRRAPPSRPTFRPRRCWQRSRAPDPHHPCSLLGRSASAPPCLRSYGDPASNLPLSHRRIPSNIKHIKPRHALARTIAGERSWIGGS